jgi:predicted NAD-dependent protein-ADP-ribosyltransferase YbiA (DUF1768 family)
MNSELERKIYDADPVFFRQKDMDMTQTCMCWGIECGDGWFEPIFEFVQKVRILNDCLSTMNMCIVASQIKSKWADFTCYWNMDVLDKGKNVELSEQQQATIDLFHSIMGDIVWGCKEKCAHTCEICGKHSIWNDEVYACGSWLTIKCLDCAQKKQREEGKITNFREGFKFLSPFAEEPIVVEGACFPTVIGAYYTVLHPEWHDVFVEMKSPSEVQAVAVSKGLCQDDEKAFKAMEKVLRIRYADGKSRERLLSTKNLDIVQSNHHHENKWGACWCGECEGKGENQYGRLLMKIRDEIIAEKEK